MIKKMPVFVILSLLFLFSCAQGLRAPVNMEPQIFMNNYDKMFGAAISKGTELFYGIDYQSRESGLIKMSRKVRYSTYTITVKFDDDNFTVKGEVDTDLINPFIGEDAEIIEDAIIKAAR
ncbi:MAG: hypothetical protein QMD11_04935 [Smithella sp.]|nr:hypothetical protein [Smithella sp.]